MDDTKFLASLRASLFHGSAVPSSVETVLLPAIAGLIVPQQAYVLGTVFHESAATMQPIAEYGHGAGHPYGVVDQSGKAPYGRGYVQLTWRYNYQKADDALGLGGRLLANYDLALEPDIAAKILVNGMVGGWFTGKSLDAYIGPVQHDFMAARRIINGTDRAALIAGYADQFLAALKGADMLTGTSAPAAPVPPSASTIAPPNPVGLVAWMQTRLNSLGASPLLTVDNQMGPMTKAAVVNFQRSRGLVPDGVVGPLTTAALKGPGA
jgi:hypothetical protein